MNQRFVVLGMVLLALTALPATLWAFRCGTELVSIGDSSSEILDKCGEPTSVEAWYETIPGGYAGPAPPRGYRSPELEPFRDTGYAVIRIEWWTYDLGSTRFVRYLKFENGILKKVTKGGYGE